ncbi:MAG: hypothetical protein PGN23_15605 [Sphingomonas adhaesiva]|uniref:hypothetical protein n=1 Tax=Sphingomonas adhaesiva TaxID=28212 RepID=UPI002FF5E6F9
MDDDISAEKRWDLLYKEWEYRHRAFWLSFNIWSVAVSLCILGPFIKPQMLEFGWLIVMLPLFGVAVSLFAWIHLLGEAKRMALVFAAFRAYRRTPDWPHPPGHGTWKQRIQTLSNAKILGNVFLYVMVPACISSIAILSVVTYDRIGSPFEDSAAGYYRFCVFAFAILFPIGGAACGLKSALNAERRKTRGREVAAQRRRRRRLRVSSSRFLRVSGRRPIWTILQILFLIRTWRRAPPSR